MQNILKSSKEDILPILNLFKLNDEMMSKIDDQYSSIQYLKLMNTNNSVEFCAEVHNYQDAGGNNKFEEISEFVLKLLCLPWSKADVEHVFSQINLVKTQVRNRLHLITVNSVLTTRSNL